MHYRFLATIWLHSRIHSLCFAISNQDFFVICHQPFNSTQSWTNCTSILYSILSQLHIVNQPALHHRKLWELHDRKKPLFTHPGEALIPLPLCGPLTIPRRSPPLVDSSPSRLTTVIMLSSPRTLSAVQWLTWKVLCWSWSSQLCFLSHYKVLMLLHRHSGGWFYFIYISGTGESLHFQTCSRAVTVPRGDACAHPRAHVSSFSSAPANHDRGAPPTTIVTSAAFYKRFCFQLPLWCLASSFEQLPTIILISANHYCYVGCQPRTARFQSTLWRTGSSLPTPSVTRSISTGANHRVTVLPTTLCFGAHSWSHPVLAEHSDSHTIFLPTFTVLLPSAFGASFCHIYNFVFLRCY